MLLLKYYHFYYKLKFVYILFISKIKIKFINIWFFLLSNSKLASATLQHKLKHHGFRKNTSKSTSITSNNHYSFNLFNQKEIKEIDRDKESGVTVEIINNNFRKLRGSVPGTLPLSSFTSPLTFSPGPIDTPYDGGLFIVDIDLGNFNFLII